MLLRCFSSHAFLRIYYWFIYGLQSFNSAGFPHSDSHGSRLISSSPWIFAAFHVLRRLSVPRHPPLALCSFTFISLNVFLHSPKFFGLLKLLSLKTAAHTAFAHIRSVSRYPDSRPYAISTLMITYFRYFFNNSLSLRYHFYFRLCNLRLLRSLHSRSVRNGGHS